MPENTFKPGVVWIDFKKEAFESSALNKEDGLILKGFHDDEDAPDYQPRQEWLRHILENASDPNQRVAVVILNRKHMQTVRDINVFCQSLRYEPPKFVVCTRAKPEEFA